MLKTENCEMDTNIFDGDICFEKAIDFCLELKGVERKDNINKIIEYNLQLRAHKGSGCDTWIVLNNLPCDKRIINIIKNGKGILELKKFNGYIEKNRKQTPQYLHFRCGMTHLECSLKNLGKTYKLRK